MNIQEFRKKYPMYDDMNDQELADKLHSKHYSDIPKQEYYSKIGVKYQGPETLGFKGIGQDIVSGAKASPGALWEMAKAAPGEIYGAGQQVFNDPKRVGQNLVTGLAQMGHGVINTPANITDYLSRKQILPESFEGKFPRQQEYNFAEMLGRQGKRPGDALISGLVEYMPYLLGGEAALAGKGAGRLGKAASQMVSSGAHAIGQNENPITAALAAGGPTATGLALGKGINKGASLISKVYPEGKFSKKVLSDVAQTASENKKGYKTILKEADKEIGEITKPKKVNFDLIEEFANKKEMETIKKVFETGKPSHAHYSQSELGRLKRNLEGRKDLSGHEKKILEAVTDAQKRIKGSLYQAFQKSGNPEFAKEYGMRTKIHAEEVIPARRNKLLNDLRKGDITEGDFEKRILNNTHFKARFGKKYPEMEFKSTVKGLGKTLKDVTKTGGTLEIMHLLGLI